MKKSLFRIVCASSALCAWVAMSAHADVTVQEKTSLDVFSVIKMHGANTTSVTADKEREDSESHCEGVMSLLCGNVQGGNIVRLDKDVTWRLEPAKKRYHEEAFATPQEMAAMRARMQAHLEKMRSCPVSQKQQPIDKSKCEMSPPKIDVHKTGDKMTIAGHDAQRTSATLTETCTDKETGDVCDTIIAVDLWLTDDKLPGSADRHAFYAAYAKKLGIDDPQGVMRDSVVKYLAPYQAQIKQLTDKSAGLKGQPLKTSLRVLMGGQQCATANKTKADQASGGNGADAANPMANVAQAGKAMSNLVGGLFHKKKSDDSSDTANNPPPADTTTPKTPDPYAQYAQMGAFSIETVMINTDPVPADRFDVPPDWKKVVPKPVKEADDDDTCPKT